MRKRMNIIIFFFSWSQISFCSGMQQSNVDIAGIKAPYIFTSQEATIVTEINNQIKRIFEELNNIQCIKSEKFKSMPQALNSAEALNSNDLKKKRKIIGGKSLYQLRKEKEEKKPILLSSREISVMNTSASVIHVQQDFDTFLIDDAFEVQQGMTIGERIIYYKQKYLNLAKKYLEAVREQKKIQGTTER